MVITFLRRNIGTIIASIGFTLLCILTFGNIAELMTEQYWINVKENITSIGFMSISLTMIQTTIRQGLAEQALQRGLNTERTLDRYEEHRKLIRSAADRIIYLPYFLQIYNRRHTHLRKREFLVNNNYSTEKTFRMNASENLIEEYEQIKVKLTVARIKWAATEIIYNKDGQIQTLQEHRRERVKKSIVVSFVLMLCLCFITRGLFFSPTHEPLWQKFVKLFTYILAIVLGSVLGIVNEYEKGAIGVPNDLEELNEIWLEFIAWKVPQWVKDEIASYEKEYWDEDDEILKESIMPDECENSDELIKDEGGIIDGEENEENSVDVGTNLQEE